MTYLDKNTSLFRQWHIIALLCFSIACGIVVIIMMGVVLASRNTDAATVRTAIFDASVQRKEIETELRTLLREYGTIKSDVQRLDTIVKGLAKP